MKIAITVIILLFAVFSILAIYELTTEVRDLRATTTKQAKVIKYLSDHLDRQNQKINASDKLIAAISTNMNRRFNNHKNWTYQATSDMAQQIADLSDQMRQPYTGKGIDDADDTASAGVVTGEEHGTEIHSEEGHI